MVDFTVITCRPIVLHDDGCHFGNTNGDLNLNFVHRDSHQHRWQCDRYDLYHGERRPAVRRCLQRQSIHVDQGRGHDHRYPICKRWNGHLVVGVSVAARRSFA